MGFLYKISIKLIVIAFISLILNRNNLNGLNIRGMQSPGLSIVSAKSVYFFPVNKIRV
jgi:hypothetical protein